MSAVETEAPANCIICPKLTFFLAGFMMILLISYPLILQSSISSTAVPYLIYSSFLTSVGVLIGISTIWLSDSNAGRNILNQEDAPTQIEVDTTPPVKHIHLTESEQWVVDYLLGEGGRCWQAELVEQSHMNPSKISRTLSKMESGGLIQRVRDGMGKRVILTNREGY